MTVPLWSAAPFVMLLLAVSVLETVARQWWDSLRNKAIIVAAVTVLMCVQLIGGHGAAGAGMLMHSLTDYVSFTVLLATLFIIAGGIEVKGSLSGTPLANMLMLAMGAVLANLIGTTGAAMVLIRPYLRANARRERKGHLVLFFILVVANAGGLLTPVGDPPLYLGFLKGVPFTWTLNLWLPWLFVNGLVLAIFNWTDQFFLNRQERARRHEGLLDELLIHEPIRLKGGLNLALLAAVVATIILSGAGTGNGGTPWPLGVREVLLAALAMLSLKLTPRDIHEANRFSFRPIAAVAIVFFGIFATMTAPLHLLNANAGKLGATTAAEFFWASGGLSAVLDNAPTYLCMTAVAAGLLRVPTDDPQYLSLLLAEGGAGYLVAISCGAVFMGCLTYIGNGPNLMVKEIAEHRGIHMPNFLAYSAAAMVIMLPVFVAATFLFFPG